MKKLQHVNEVWMCSWALVGCRPGRGGEEDERGGSLGKEEERSVTGCSEVMFLLCFFLTAKCHKLQSE